MNKCPECGANYRTVFDHDINGAVCCGAQIADLKAKLATAKYDALIEVAEKWEDWANKGEVAHDDIAMDPMTIDDLRGYATTLRTYAEETKP